jgi:hypothetical protein
MSVLLSLFLLLQMTLVLVAIVDSKLGTMKWALKTWGRGGGGGRGLLQKRREHKLTLSNLGSQTTTNSTSSSEEVAHKIVITVLATKSVASAHGACKPMALRKHTPTADWRSAAGFQPRRRTLHATIKTRM